VSRVRCLVCVGQQSSVAGIVGQRYEKWVRVGHLPFHFSANGAQTELINGTFPISEIIATNRDSLSRCGGVS